VKIAQGEDEGKKKEATVKPGIASGEEKSDSKDRENRGEEAN